MNVERRGERHLHCGDYACELEDQLEPARVSEITGIDVTGEVVAITAAGSMTCILHDAGFSVTCFGDNRFGQAPDETMSLTTPAISIVAGGRHTCVLYADGTASCFGHGRWGELGDGLFANNSSLVTSPADEATQLARGVGQDVGHACYVANGHVRCWGWRGAALRRGRRRFREVCCGPTSLRRSISTQVAQVL